MAAGWFILLNKIIFLDRDGVINKKAAEHNYVKSWDEFQFLPDVPKAIKLFTVSGYLVIVVTNQRGIARKIMTMDSLKTIHKNMCDELWKYGAVINDVFVCPHDKNTCNCRKPNIGLFLQAEQKYPVNKDKSFMIGDSVTDIAAGKKYRIKTIAIGNNDLGADYRFDNLLKAAQFIIGVKE